MHLRGPGLGRHGDRRRRGSLRAQGRALRGGGPRPLHRAHAVRPHPARQGDALDRAVRDQDRAALPVVAGPRLVRAARGVIVALCAMTLATTGVDEEGVRAIIRLTARTSLALFLLAFTASAAFRLWGGRWPRWLLVNRRYLGLSFAVSHFLHLLAIVVLAARFPDRFWGGTRASTMVVGGSGYVFVALMAATSNDASVAWLGPRRWKALHTVGAYWLW